MSRLIWINQALACEYNFKFTGLAFVNRAMDIKCIYNNRSLAEV